MASLLFGERLGAYFYGRRWPLVRQKHKVVTIAAGSSNTCRRVCADAEKLKRLRAGSCATLGSATLPCFPALCLLGSTSRGTRGRLKGRRSGQGSYSFLFPFCSYHSYPASALSLAASVDFHLELISAFLEPAKGHSSSEVRVPDRCGPSPEPLQQQLNTHSSCLISNSAGPLL